MATGIGWTDDELRETLRVYLNMADMQARDEKFTKSALNEKLRAVHLKGRTRASVEYRMRNISTIMEQLGRPIVQGYLPAYGVGPTNTIRMKDILAELLSLSESTSEPTADTALLDVRTQKLRHVQKLRKPKGQRKVAKVVVTSTAYVRDPEVKAWVLQNAGGVCQGCGSPAPFVLSDGLPFLEVHHVKWLAEGGSDTTQNAVALCPNCHRRCHYSIDYKAFAHTLYARNSRLVPE